MFSQGDLFPTVYIYIYISIHQKKCFKMFQTYCSHLIFQDRKSKKKRTPNESPAHTRRKYVGWCQVSKMATTRPVRRRFASKTSSKLSLPAGVPSTMSRNWLLTKKPQGAGEWQRVFFSFLRAKSWKVIVFHSFEWENHMPFWRNMVQCEISLQWCLFRKNPSDGGEKIHVLKRFLAGKSPLSMQKDKLISQFKWRCLASAMGPTYYSMGYCGQMGMLDEKIMEKPNS